MATKLIHFLLIYDRDLDILVSNEAFEDSRTATDAYEKAERDAQNSDRRMDIVLVGSDSLETVKVTHSNYFSGSALRLVRDVLESRFSPAYDLDLRMEHTARV